MNSDAFLRGFFSRIEKFAVESSVLLGRVHTTNPGREIFAPSRSSFTGSDQPVAAAVSKLRRQGVKGKLPMDPKRLSSYQEMAAQYRRASGPGLSRR